MHLRTNYNEKIKENVFREEKQTSLERNLTTKLT